ncbi:MAG: hypothetical protein U9N36_10235 [Euryarchaeota archaeon]|nr:hypothetical protein [Euryarchaeota archaeon]
MKKTTVGLISIIAIVSIVIFAGCVEEERVKEKISAAEDISRAGLLIGNGAARIEKIRLEIGAYSDAKTKLTASEVDYEEALKILNNSATDYDYEKDEIRTVKVMCSYNLDSVAVFRNLIICSEHLDKVDAYAEGDDFASMRSELKLAEDALNDTLPFISTAKEKCFSIDIDTAPAEIRSELLENRISVEKREKMVLEFGMLVSGMHPYIDGTEHALKATKYMQNEVWNSAEFEFRKCSVDFSESKDVLEDLKSSEFTEISVPAITRYGISTKMLEALPHLEAGCRYADRGNFKKADKEFNKVPVF